jgi:hypothetical protein
MPMIFTLFNIFVPSAILAGSYLIFRTDRAWDTSTALVGAVLVAFGIILPQVFPDIMYDASAQSALAAIDGGDRLSSDGVRLKKESAIFFVSSSAFGAMAFSIGFFCYALRKRRSQSVG